MKKTSFVGFDFFDTIVHRDCNPEVVILEWSREVSSFINFKIDPLTIYNYRKSIQRNSNKEEMSYYELISSLYKIIENDLEISLEEFYNNALELELNVEMGHIFVDKKNVSLLAKEANNNKVIIISDFYVGQELFYKVLNKYNLMRYINKIYVSSDIGFRKSTGNLYKYVLRDLKIDANQLTMYGDNKVSDVSVPKNLGINSNLLINESKSTNIISYNIIEKYLKKFESNDLFGGYTGPLILFCEKLYKKAREKNVHNFLFCAREGQNLMKLFNIFQKIMYPQHIVPTTYIYVSRKSTMMPSLKNIDDERFDRIFNQYTELTVHDFLFSIGFNEDQINDLVLRIGISSDALITNNKDDSLMKRLKKENYFRTIYEKERSSSREAFTKYLNRVNDFDDSIYIVDIGWKGTIQDNIYNAFNGKKRVFGFYYGLFKDAKKSIDNNKFGLIFDEKENKKCFRIYSYEYVQLERVFAADHGQTLYYEIKNDSSVPVLSTNKDDTLIFDNIKDDQMKLNDDFKYLVELISNSMINMEKLSSIVEKRSLHYNCITLSKNWKKFHSYNNKVKENFGNVSKKKVKKDNTFQRDKTIKKNYHNVIYTYRILDQLHLKLFYPLASLYCHVVYFIKRVTLK